MTNEIPSPRQHRPAFPRWLLPTVIFYLFIAVVMIDDSLRVHITKDSDGRVVADDWTLALLRRFAAGTIDSADAGTIAGSIASNFLFFIAGCLIGLTAIGLIARRRSANAFSHLLNIFQFTVGLAFVCYYAADREIVFLATGAPFSVLAAIQYRAQSRPDVRHWLRSYVVEFRSIQSQDQTTRRALRRSSFRKTACNIIFGLQMLLLVATTASLVESMVDLSIGTGGSMDALLRFVMIPLVAFYLLILPVVVIYPVLAIVALFWRNPPRVLLLRQFHAPETSITLKNIIRDSVGYLGHVYTLSDPGIHQRWYMKWPVVIPQMWLLRFHESIASDALAAEGLERKVRRTFFRNINWFSSSGRLFSISATDDAWKSCVSRLLTLTDVILFDISNPTPNIDWELKQIIGQKTADHTIFITKESKLTQAVELLQNNGMNAELGVNVFLYDNDGFCDMNGVMERLVSLLTAGHARQDRRLLPRGGYTRSE